MKQLNEVKLISIKKSAQLSAFMRTRVALGGWAGFTTRDLARCRIMARFIALIYNWWNLFVRLAEPDKHLEAVTSRPPLLSAIAARSRHARQTTLKVSSSHARAGWAASVLSGIARFLRRLIQSAEQLTAEQRWRQILAHAMRGILGPPTQPTGAPHGANVMHPVVELSQKRDVQSVQLPDLG